MKNKGFRIIIALLCLILAFMLTVQIKSIRKISSAGLDKLRAEELQTSLTSVKMLAGLTPVKGQGIIVTLNDSTVQAQVGNTDEESLFGIDNINENQFIIHDSDILLVINELRASGAEAISINDQRVISTSEVRCAGPVLSINNNKTAAPFEIKAIGNARNMENALRMRSGIIYILQQYGIQVDVTKQTNLIVPAMSGEIFFKYASPAEGGGK